MYALLAIVPVAGLAYLSTLRRPETHVTKDKFQHQTWRQTKLEEVPNGVKNSKNTFAYWNQQPFLRPRQQNFQFHEAEATTNYHELHAELSKAREEGDVGRISYVMAEYFRQRDRALQNVVSDYAYQQNFIQVRKTEGNRGRLRSMITTRDEPKLEMASRTVPHLKSLPIRPEVTRSYWRPIAYHVPYYELA
jgi:hypothetical protein